MKLTRAILAAALLLLFQGCTVIEKLMVRPSFPVVTTIELRNCQGSRSVGEIVSIAGTITSCDVSTRTVVLDGYVECVLAEGLGDMQSYAANIGSATAIRGLLSKTSKVKYPYRLRPSGQCLCEAKEARRKLLAEEKGRPGLKFNGFRGGIVDFSPNRPWMNDLGNH